jgi:hypothetical protein
VTPSAELAHSQCGVVTTGAPLDSARFARHFAEARKRLDVSDFILRGDLIPAR